MRSGNFQAQLRNCRILCPQRYAAETPAAAAEFKIPGSDDIDELETDTSAGTNLY